MPTIDRPCSAFTAATYLIPAMAAALAAAGATEENAGTVLLTAGFDVRAIYHHGDEAFDRLQMGLADAA